MQAIDSLHHLVNAIVDSLIKKNEAKALEFANNACALIQQYFPISISHSHGDMKKIFGEFYKILDSRNSDAYVLKFCKYLCIVYGEHHVVLSDVYTSISASYAKCGKFRDALDFAGKALVIRMETLGLMEEKTAESHFSLGLVYRLIGDFQQSRKQLRICALYTIYRNSFHEIFDD